MKRPCFFFLFLVLNLVVHSQDTVRIRNIKDYQQGKMNMLVSPSGKLIQVKVLDRSEAWQEEDEQEMEGDDLRSPAAGGNRMVDPSLTPAQKERIKANACKNFRFAGLSRSKVKTSITLHQPRTYTSLPKFMNTLFPDEDMKVVVRALSKPYAARAIQEDKTVTVKNLFLLAYAREKDNDYHLILTNSDGTIFFNAELSGLPGNSANSYQKLKAARLAFENFPGGVSCGKYTFLETPLKILSIKGSLFFDVDHPAGQVGPLGSRPSTAWEIHPVTEIKFE
jgi:hypothetical protein